MTRKKKLLASKKQKKTKPHKTKKFYRLNKKLISTKHYWAAVRDVWQQFGYHLPGGDKHVEQQLQLRKWISVALSYELAGYNHTHAFSALKKAEKDECLIIDRQTEVFQEMERIFKIFAVDQLLFRKRSF